MAEPSRRFTLRDLPFVARLTLAVFLISVGIGYCAALVQLHVQQASPGQVLPGDDELIASYHGKNGMGVLERLVTANENLPFNGSGKHAPGVHDAVPLIGTIKIRGSSDRDFVGKLSPDDQKERGERHWANGTSWTRRRRFGRRRSKQVQEQVRKEREGEAAALVAWIHADADKESYEKDYFPRPDSLKDTPITGKFVTKDTGREQSQVAILRLIRAALQVPP